MVMYLGLLELICISDYMEAGCLLVLIIYLALGVFFCLQILGCIAEMFLLSVILSTLNLHGDNVVSSWQRGLRRERWWFMCFTASFHKIM
jgi:hypothetical protein